MTVTTDFQIPYPTLIVVPYALTAVAMGVDLLAGLIKARRLGRKCTSRGLKQTCHKAGQYFLPMIVLSCIDIVAAVIFTAPWLTLAYAAFCMTCEVLSVIESTDRKAAINRAMQQSRDLMEVLPELRRLVDEIKQLQ